MIYQSSSYTYQKPHKHSKYHRVVQTQENNEVVMVSMNSKRKALRRQEKCHKMYPCEFFSINEWNRLPPAVIKLFQIEKFLGDFSVGGISFLDILVN